jgi:ABC-2 type transport system ATP-binding protein
MLQRVQFVGAIVHQPELLILDEPFSGLDPVSVRLLKVVIAAERRRGATILFSTHVMAQAEELCDRVVMIHKGRKVLDQPITQLKRQYDVSRVLFEPLRPAAGDADALGGIAGVTELAGRDGEYELRLAPGTDPRR